MQTTKNLKCWNRFMIYFIKNGPSQTDFFHEIFLNYLLKFFCFYYSCLSYLLVLCVKIPRFSCTVIKVSTVSVSWLTLLPHFSWSIRIVYRSFSLRGSPSTPQSTPPSATMRPPKYGPVSTSISDACGKHFVA